MSTDAISATWRLNVPTGYGDLPEGWLWAPLGDLCRGIYDCPHSTPKLTAMGPHVARTQDISSGVFRTEKAAHVSEETYLERTRRATPSWGDLLYSREGTYFGIAAEIPRDTKVCLGQRMVLIRPNQEHVDFRFLRYWLNSPLMAAYIHGFRDGSVAERLNLPTIRTLPVLLPPTFEQKAISGILGVLDDKISVNDRIARVARQLGMSLFGAATKMESTPITVEEISTYINRGQAPKYTTNEDENGLIVLNQKCIRDGRVNLDPARKTQLSRVPTERQLATVDVLINSTGVGTLGRVGIWSHNLRATVDSHVTIVRIDHKVVPPILGAFAMLSAQPVIEAMGEGSTGQTELSRAKLGRLEIYLPSENHDLLAQKLTALEAKSDTALQECRTLAALRDTLLPQLMSGRLRVRDAEHIVEDAL